MRVVEETWSFPASDMRIDFGSPTSKLGVLDSNELIIWLSDPVTHFPFPTLLSWWDNFFYHIHSPINVFLFPGSIMKCDLHRRYRNTECVIVKGKFDVIHLTWQFLSAHVGQEIGLARIWMSRGLPPIQFHSFFNSNWLHLIPPHWRVRNVAFSCKGRKKVWTGLLWLTGNFLWRGRGGEWICIKMSVADGNEDIEYIIWVCQSWQQIPGGSRNKVWLKWHAVSLESPLVTGIHNLSKLSDSLPFITFRAEHVFPQFFLVEEGDSPPFLADLSSSHLHLPSKGLASVQSHQLWIPYIILCLFSTENFPLPKRAEENKGERFFPSWNGF